jgi:tripartite ATP-independent transporter DctM subunit
MTTQTVLQDAAKPQSRLSVRPRLTELFENSLSMGVLAGMLVLPLAEIAGRLAFGRGIPGSIPLVQHLTLWCAFLGAALAARSRRLLALSTADFLPKRWRGMVSVFTSAVAIAVCATLLLASLDLIRVEREVGAEVALGLPLWVVLLIMPVGLAIIGARLVTMASEGALGRWLAACGLIIPALFGAFPFLRESNGFMLLVGAVLLIATTLGLPIFAALAGTALALFWSMEIPIAAVSAELYRLTAQPMLPAVPLFTLAGFVLAEGKASHRLMRTFTAVFGWIPGGLAIVTTLLLAFFTPLTGASGVTILSMGGLLLPVLRQAGYPERTSVGLVTVSGSIGLLFVPSLPVILYGVYAKTPIDELFIGGLFPGLLLVLLVAGYGAHKGWRAGAQRTPFRAREAGAAIWEAKWELGTPVVILAGLLGGFATLVEAAAITVAYALLVECFVYRELAWRDISHIFVESATLVGGFLIILASALAFTNYLIHAEVPIIAMDWVRTHIESPLVFLLALNLLLIVVGALMDIYSAIFVLVPLIAPMGVAYGIDPVHLGVIFLANMELGYLMPPMGENLFLASYRFKQPLVRIYLSTAPFVILLLIAVLLITYVPSLTLWPLHFFRH